MLKLILGNYKNVTSLIDLLSFGKHNFWRVKANRGYAYNFPPLWLRVRMLLVATDFSHPLGWSNKKKTGFAAVRFVSSPRLVRECHVHVRGVHLVGSRKCAARHRRHQESRLDGDTAATGTASPGVSALVRKIATSPQPIWWWPGGPDGARCSRQAPPAFGIIDRGERRNGIYGIQDTRQSAKSSLKPPKILMEQRHNPPSMANGCYVSVVFAVFRRRRCWRRNEFRRLGR